jgi:hypothetical protein
MPPVTPVTLTPGKPVTTTDSQIVVAAMQPGTYTFELVVFDDLGMSSKPARCQVVVQKPVIPIPTPVPPTPTPS